jgi:hypothetical protein
MKLQTAKVLFLVLSFCVFTSSCVSTLAPTPPTTNSVATVQASTKSFTPTSIGDSQGCLISEYKFAYQLGEIPPGFDWSKTQNLLLPPLEWKKVAQVSQPSYLRLLQQRNGKTILWVYGNDGDLLRYSISDANTNEIEILPGPHSQRMLALHVDPDNNVWGSRSGPLHQGDTDALLNRYNEQTNQWEIVKFDLPNQDNLAISDLKFDKQGNVWFFVIGREEKALYRLNPTTMKIERYLAEYNLDSYFTISNNTIFISAISDAIIPAYSLIQYRFDDGDVNVTPIPSRLQDDYQGSKTMPVPNFVDSKKRVWFGARGWFDLLTDQWHYVVPDSVFITAIPGAGEWRWSEPEFMLETNDGIIWYKALRATGWVDPNEGTWCVFTNFSSNIFVDGLQRLWILVDETLYMRR